MCTHSVLVDGTSRPLSGGYCEPLFAEVDSLPCVSACDAPLACIAGRCQLLCPTTGCPSGLSCGDDGAGNQLCLR